MGSFMGPLSAVVINLLTTVWTRRIGEQQSSIALRVESLPPRLDGQDPAESTGRLWADEDLAQEAMTSTPTGMTEDAVHDMTDDDAKNLSMMEDAKSATSMLSAEILTKVTSADLVEQWRVRGHEIRSPSPLSRWDSASTCTPPTECTDTYINTPEDSLDRGSSPMTSSDGLVEALSEAEGQGKDVEISAMG